MVAATRSCREREGRRAASFLKGLDGGLRMDGGMQRVGGVEGSLLETLVLPVRGVGEGKGLRLIALGGHSMLEPKRRQLLCSWASRGVAGVGGGWLVRVTRDDGLERCLHTVKEGHPMLKAPPPLGHSKPLLVHTKVHSSQ